MKDGRTPDQNKESKNCSCCTRIPGIREASKLLLELPARAREQSQVIFFWAGFVIGRGGCFTIEFDRKGRGGEISRQKSGLVLSKKCPPIFENWHAPGVDLKYYPPRWMIYSDNE